MEVKNMTRNANKLLGLGLMDVVDNNGVLLEDESPLIGKKFLGRDLIFLQILVEGHRSTSAANTAAP